MINRSVVGLCNNSVQIVLTRAIITIQYNLAGVKTEFITSGYGRDVVVHWV